LPPSIVQATAKHTRGRKFGKGATELLAALERTEADANRRVEAANHLADDANHHAAKLRRTVESLNAENAALRASLQRCAAHDYVPGQVVDALVAEMHALTVSLTNPNAKAKVEAAIREAIALADSSQLREGCDVAFRKVDVDQSASLSVLEFGPCARQLFTETVGWALPDKTLVYLFAQFDANRDNHLSLDEFHDFFRYLILVVTKVRAEGFREAERMPAPEGTLPFIEFEALNVMVDGFEAGARWLPFVGAHSTRDLDMCDLAVCDLAMCDLA